MIVISVPQPVPFVANLDDAMHCYPASYLMVLRYFLPEQTFTLDDAIRITGKEQGRAPWPLKGPIWLVNNGFDVKVWFDFDYPALANEGPSYIRRKYGDEIADWQEANGSGFDHETVERFLQTVNFEQRSPEMVDIERVLKEDQLAQCTVNLRRLNNLTGYENHSVVVHGLTDTHVVLNNPGPPATANQEVPIDDFLAAWGATRDERYLMSVGRPPE